MTEYKGRETRSGQSKPDAEKLLQSSIHVPDPSYRMGVAPDTVGPKLNIFVSASFMTFVNTAGMQITAADEATLIV